MDSEVCRHIPSAQLQVNAWKLILQPERKTPCSSNKGGFQRFSKGGQFLNGQNYHSISLNFITNFKLWSTEANWRMTGFCPKHCGGKCTATTQSNTGHRMASVVISKLKPLSWSLCWVHLPNCDSRLLTVKSYCGLNALLTYCRNCYISAYSAISAATSASTLVSSFSLLFYN